MQKLIVAAVWLALWWLLSTLIDLKSMLLPDFTSVVSALGSILSSPPFYSHLGQTLMRLLPGLFASILAGIPIGLLLAQYSGPRTFFEPFLTLIRGIPVASLFPVAILLFGIGDGARSALTIYVAFPILVTSTLAGAMERPENRIRRDYLRIHKDRLRWFDMPLCLLWDAMPSIIGGVRVAIGLALVVIIVSEMFFVGGSGIGWYTWDQYQAFNFPNMYAAILVIGSISLAIDSALNMAIRVLGMNGYEN